jgi:hypothetical protein
MTPIDRRIAFLARAWARLTLVEAGEMDPEEAVVGLIESIDPHWLIHNIVGYCPCELSTGRRQRWPDNWGAVSEVEAPPMFTAEPEPAEAPA